MSSENTRTQQIPVPEIPAKRRTADLLTVCVKAGRAVKGFDSACTEVKEGRAFCMLTALDASAKTVKEAEFVCGRAEVPVLRTELTKEELGRICGKETAVLAVCDRGFTDTFIRIISPPER